MAPRIRVVSWDVDGTLYSLPRATRNLVRVAGRHLWARRGLQLARDVVDLARAREAMQRVRARGGELKSGSEELRCHERGRGAFLRWYGPAVALADVRPGIRPLLRAFRERGLRQVVISDYEPQYKLEALGLEREFEATFAGESIGFLKPSPELFRRAIRELGIAPEELLHIGDRPEMDAACAGEVGFRAVIIGRALPRPEELLALLE